MIATADDLELSVGAGVLKSCDAGDKGREVPEAGAETPFARVRATLANGRGLTCEPVRAPRTSRMNYASAPPFRPALETRQGAVSRAGGPSLIRLRKEVIVDRLLARLVAVAPDRWICKGALALEHRFGDRARTTRDVDLAGTGDVMSATWDPSTGSWRP